MNTTVTRLTQTAGGWTLDLRDAGGEASSEHGAVIFCGTAPKLAELEINCGRAALPRGPEIGAAQQTRPPN